LRREIKFRFVPPAAHFHVFGFAFADRHAFSGKIGKRGQQGAHVRFGFIAQPIELRNAFL